MKTPKTANRRSKDSPGSVLNYRPQGRTLHQFHQQTTRTKGLIGPLGSGKTYAAIFEILIRIHNQTPDANGLRDTSWVIARNTYPDLISATIKDFRAITDDLPFGEFKMAPVIHWECEYPRNDGTTVKAYVEFKSFDGKQDNKKAKGMQLTGVWVDELSEFDKENWDMLVGRIGRHPRRETYLKTVRVVDEKYLETTGIKRMVDRRISVGESWRGALFTTNACPRDHWLAKIALRPIENFWVGIQPGGLTREGNRWAVNPKAENTNNLPSDYYTAQVPGKKESWIRQMLCNEFVHHSDGRPVHPDFNEQLHVADLKPLNGIPLYLGMDWGRTPAAVIMQQQPNGQWFVLEEICLTNAGADKLGATVRRVLNARYDGFRVSQATGDPAGSQLAQTRDETPLDLFALESGFTALPAHTNDFEIRAATLDKLLTQIIEGQPAIMIDRSCHMTIGGLSGEYQFRRLQVAGKDLYQDKPDKGPTSHVCEALHYGLMGAGESEQLFHSQWDEMMTDMEGYEPNYAAFE